MIRIGIDTPDTSHVRLFIEAFEESEIARATAILPADTIRDASVVESFAEENALALVSGRDQLLQLCDSILLLGIDWSGHVNVSLPYLVAGKRVFVDKPITGSYADSVRLKELIVQYPRQLFGGSALPYHPAFQGFLESFRFFTQHSSASVEIYGAMDSYFMASHSYELASAMLGTVRDAVVDWQEDVVIHSAIGQHEVTIALRQAATNAEHPWSIRARVGNQLLLCNFPLQGIYDGLLDKLTKHLLRGTDWDGGISVELALAAERSGNTGQPVSILDLDLGDVIPSEAFLADYAARNATRPL